MCTLPSREGTESNPTNGGQDALWILAVWHNSLSVPGFGPACTGKLISRTSSELRVLLSLPVSQYHAGPRHLSVIDVF